MRPSEITPEHLVLERRRSMGQMAAVGTVGALVGLGTLGQGLFAPVWASSKSQGAPQKSGADLSPPPQKSSYVLMDRPTDWSDATLYNNFYEFGTQKSDPARHAPGRLKLRPWTLTVDGLVGKPKTYSVDDLFQLATLEERVYRLRCVEGWSMVIPWAGYSLSQLISRAQPLGSAKYVEFTTLNDSQMMPGLSSRVLEWPYREGLRMDEAMHSLTLLTLGMYGKPLPAQNGGPVRLVVPWKYGFKSAKSIVRIRLTEAQPASSWHQSAPHEYGFYSNVNPSVAHRRWSQATERRIGEDSLFAARRPTLPFNGYAEAVEPLYRGMDLRRYF